MDCGDAFKAADAPLRPPRNLWHTIDPIGEFIAVTVWQHEWDSGYGGIEPRQGLVKPGAKLHLGNTTEDIGAWADNRAAADSAPPGSVYGWKLMKEHHQRTFNEKLEVRIIMVVAKDVADGSERASIEDARYKDKWQATTNYFDPVSGAYEYPIWVA